MLKLPMDDHKHLQDLLSPDRGYLLTPRQRAALKRALLALNYGNLVESEADGSSERIIDADRIGRWSCAESNLKPRLPSEATPKGNMLIQGGVMPRIPECGCSDPFRPDHPVGKCKGGIGGVL